MHRFARKTRTGLAATLALAAASTLPLGFASAARAELGALRSMTRPGTAEPFLVVDDARPTRRANGAAATLPTATPRAELERLVPHAHGLELVVENDGNVIIDAATRVVRYEQRFMGVPVLGRGASVRLDGKGRASLASARLETRLPANATPHVDASAAATAARSMVRVPLAASAARLAIAPFEEGGVLVWQFEPRMPGVPFSPRILVDANTGLVRLARDRAVHLEPRARVFASNPTRSPGLVSLPFAIAPNEGSLVSDRIVAKTCVDKGNTHPYPGFASGIHVCDLVSLARPGVGGDYDDAPIDDAAAPGRDEDAFAEASMYYHLGRVYSFFEALAPPSRRGTRIVHAMPFTAVANLRLAPGLQGGDTSQVGNPTAPLAPYSNAFFAPGGRDGFGSLYDVGTGALWFGQGPRRDYAYDGDVVYHEFTHAIIDATLELGSYTFDAQGLSAAPGALNEALADLFAAALSGDPDIGEYAASDVKDSLAYVRTLANDDRLPARLVGEVHFDSTAFSGAMWAARSTLSPLERVVFDRAVYETLLVNAKFDAPTFGEFVAVMLETFRLRSSLGAWAIETELATRGLWPDCERVLEASNRTVVAPSDSQGRLGFQSPGKSETALSLVPGVVTFRSAVNPTAGRLLVRFAGRTQSSSAGFLDDSGGTPFTPTVLARFDSPITYRGSVHDANAAVAAKAEGSQWSADIPIPAGATTVYVQIANVGEKSGLYDGVRISVAAPAIADAGAADQATEDAPPAGCAVASARSHHRERERERERALASMAFAGLAIALFRFRRTACRTRR